MLVDLDWKGIAVRGAHHSSPITNRFESLAGPRRLGATESIRSILAHQVLLGIAPIGQNARQYDRGLFPVVLGCILNTSSRHLMLMSSVLVYVLPHAITLPPQLAVAAFDWRVRVARQ